MQTAYLITYLGPTNMFGARLVMDGPGKRRFIPRDFSISAEAQAAKLGAIAALGNDKWVYIINNESVGKVA